MEFSNEIEIQRSIIDYETEEYNPFVVTFYYNSKNILYGFVARGETGFTQYGLDIIAAGVSALVINTVNSVQQLTNDHVDSEVKRNFTKFILPKLQDNNGSREAIVLLQSLKLGIHSIQNTYGQKYITIEEIREEKKTLLKRLFVK
ncbi:ribosomal-processing cysteine protease Prp [Paenibacillus plantarum]|nr:ribosomal-processing cysteine protease Prp [Paenibacillus plantarum]